MEWGLEMFSHIYSCCFHGGKLRKWQNLASLLAWLEQNLPMFLFCGYWGSLFCREPRPIWLPALLSAKLWGVLAGHCEIGSSEPMFTTPGQAMLRKRASGCSDSSTLIHKPVTSESLGSGWGEWMGNTDLIRWRWRTCVCNLVKSRGIGLYTCSVWEAFLCLPLNNILISLYKGI